jgi:hypothetical protein
MGFGGSSTDMKRSQSKSVFYSPYGCTLDLRDFQVCHEISMVPGFISYFYGSEILGFITR